MKLIKLGAEWCGPCKTMDKRLEKFDACPVEYIDVDDEANDELVDKYGVRNIPVLILIDDEKDDKEVKRWVGSIMVKK